MIHRFSDMHSDFVFVRYVPADKVPGTKSRGSAKSKAVSKSRRSTLNSSLTQDKSVLLSTSSIYNVQHSNNLKTLLSKVTKPKIILKWHLQRCLHYQIYNQSTISWMICFQQSLNCNLIVWIGSWTTINFEFSQARIVLNRVTHWIFQQSIQNQK